MKNDIISNSRIKTLNLVDFCSKYSLYLVFVVLLIISSLLSPAFFSFYNIVNLLRQASFIGLISLGMTFVILTGGIDLSVGAIFAFSGVFLAYLFHVGSYSGYVATLSPVMPSFYILLLALLSGALFGLLNGLMIAKAKLVPFVVTVGSMVAIRGLAYSLTGGRTVFGIGPDLHFLGIGVLRRIPVPVIIWAVAAVLCWVILKYTRFGRRIYAIGGDEEVARLSGIKVNFHKVMAYVISGFFSALAGIIMAAHLDQGEPRMGQDFELDAIAAVVLGGTSLFGGVGTVQGTIIGCLILAIITNILNLIGVHPYPQQIAKGAIIIGGILLQDLVQKREQKGKQ